MLTDLAILGFCGATGFVAAGVVGSFYSLVTSKPVRFTLISSSLLGAFSSFLFFAVTGPAIIAAAAWRRQVLGSDSLAVAIGGIALAALWSVCSGLIVLQLVLSLRHGFV